MTTMWQINPHTLIDLLRRKPSRGKHTMLAVPPEPWGPTIIRETENAGLEPKREFHPVNRCCDFRDWYTCPEGEPDFLYYRCQSCGGRWNPWPVNHRKYLLAQQTIGQEILLDHQGIRTPEQTRINYHALGYPDSES